MTENTVKVDISFSEYMDYTGTKKRQFSKGKLIIGWDGDNKNRSDGPTMNFVF